LAVSASARAWRSFLEGRPNGPSSAPELDQSVDPREQLPGSERLDDVVVGPGLEALGRGLFARAGGEEQDRHVAGGRSGPKRVNQPEAVEVRHHHVGDDQVGQLPGRSAECERAVGHRLDRVARREKPGDVAAHVGVVVRDEHARRWLGTPSASGARSDGPPIRRLLLRRKPPHGLLDEGQRSEASDGLGRGVRQALPDAHHEPCAPVHLARGFHRPAVEASELEDQRQTYAGALVGA
jgi:hypothetical protein